MKAACDCHVHVFGAPGRYPFWAGRTYTPPQASVDELLAVQAKLGLERVVIVQASPYGTDNRCMLDALQRLGRRARGVFGWHLQLWTKAAMLAALHDALSELSVPLVVDHFGLARSLEEAAPLLSLLRKDNTWIKLSAAHRVGGEVDALARAFIAVRPDRLVWGTDWPHPGMGPRTPDAIQPFDAIDDAAALARLQRWARDEAVLGQILVDNPARLYDF